MLGGLANPYFFTALNVSNIFSHSLLDAGIEHVNVATLCILHEAGHASALRLTVIEP